MPAFIDMTGQRFGRLTVTRRVPNPNIHQQARWAALCDCGRTTEVTGGNLRRGVTQSCGCLRSDVAGKAQTKHGHKPRNGHESPTHASWRAMLERSTNPNSTHYHNYGGRGITVCERWRDFRNFLVDMGERPEGLTLDRIDVDGNYEPGNCRWATASQQQMNKRPKVAA